MFILLKVIIVVILAVVGPILFFKFASFIAHAFLKDDLNWKKWRISLRVTLIIIACVYLFVGAGIGKTLVTYIYKTPDKGNLISQEINAAAEPHPNEFQNPVQTLFHSDMKPLEPHPAVTGCIKLGNNRKFGVNWEITADGLKITRLSAGPMKEAGLTPGDTLTHINGDPIESESKLLQIRDAIYSGTLSPALITVLRDHQELFFHLER